MEISDKASETLRFVMQSFLSSYGTPFEETFEECPELERAWQELNPKESLSSWVAQNCRFASEKGATQHQDV